MYLNHLLHTKQIEPLQKIEPLQNSTKGLGYIIHLNWDCGEPKQSTVLDLTNIDATNPKNMDTIIDAIETCERTLRIKPTDRAQRIKYKNTLKGKTVWFKDRLSKQPTGVKAETIIHNMNYNQK